MLMKLFNMTVFKTKIKEKRAKLIFCLLAGSILLVFAGRKIMALLSHQMLHLCFYVLPFEQCLYFYQMYLVKYYRKHITINFIASNMQGKIIDKKFK